MTEKLFSLRALRSFLVSSTSLERSVLYKNACSFLVSVVLVLV